MSATDFQAVKATHRELWEQYGRLLEHVDQPEISKMLKVLVEGHIREKLDQLSKVYTRLGIKRGGAQDEFGDWLKGVAADCDQVANQLISPKEALLAPFRLVTKILAVSIGLITLLYFGTTDIGEVYTVLKEDIVTFSKILPMIINVSSIIFSLVSVLMIWLFTGIFKEKDDLFRISESALTLGKTPGLPPGICSVEYQLFSMLGTGYQPEFPLHKLAAAISLNAAFLMIMNILILINPLGKAPPSLTWITVGGLILGNSLIYWRLIRPRVKAIPPYFSLARVDSQS